MGILRRPREAERRLPIFQTVAKAVEIMRRESGRPLVLAEIAEQCGFVDASSFAQHFRKRTGCSPNQLRQERRKNRFP